MVTVWSSVVADDEIVQAVAVEVRAGDADGVPPVTTESTTANIWVCADQR